MHAALRLRTQTRTAEALAYLYEHFEYICCEIGMQNDLCDALRGCIECRKWAAKCVVSP
jgi:hypothetical protein